MGHYTSLYFRVLCIAGLSWGIGRAVEGRRRSCRKRVEAFCLMTEWGKNGNLISPDMGLIISSPQFVLFVVVVVVKDLRQDHSWKN